MTGGDRAPAYMAELIDRGASLLQLQHPQPGPVRFEWWAAGCTTAYLATIEWPRSSGTDGPRVVIFRARSGDFVCQSLPGRPFELDHSTFNVDTVAPDEHAQLVRAGRELATELAEDWIREGAAACRLLNR